VNALLDTIRGHHPGPQVVGAKFRAGADFKAVVNGEKKIPARKP